VAMRAEATVVPTGGREGRSGAVSAAAGVAGESSEKSLKKFKKLLKSGTLNGEFFMFFFRKGKTVKFKAEEKEKFGK
jgi:hypothetical protein